MSNVADGREWILPDAEAVAQNVAEFLTEAALAKKDRFVLALSGGSTPKRLYQILAGSGFAERFPWSKTELFFGDERFVPPGHPDSNYRMVNEALLSHVSIPFDQVHRMPSEGDPGEAAHSYERDLRATYGRESLEHGRPLFDVVLLGLGENGHTASLFPGTAVLEERAAWVGTCVPHDAPNRRLTLTYPAIASSAHVLFLIAGSGKHDIAARVRRRDPELPASHITSDGEIVWVMDADAAGRHG